MTQRARRLDLDECMVIGDAYVDAIRRYRPMTILYWKASGARHALKVNWYWQERSAAKCEK